MIVRRFFMFLVSAMLLSQTLSAGNETRYRVSGIVLNPDRPLAMIERSDGEQSLLRVGDRLEGLTVELIEAEGVILTDGLRRTRLPLRGEPTALSDLEAIARTRELQSADGNASQTLNFHAARLGLAQLEQQRPRSAEAASAKPTPDVQRREEARLEQRLNQALGLPSHAVIQAVDREPVESPRAAIPLLTERIEQGHSIRLEVEGIPGVDVLYLTPDYDAPPPRPRPN